MNWIKRSDSEMAPEFAETKSEFCRMGIVQKDKEEIIVAIEKIHGIRVNQLKGKYLSYEQIVHREKLIREVKI